MVAMNVRRRFDVSLQGQGLDERDLEIVSDDSVK